MATTEQRPIGRQLFAHRLQIAAECGDRQRRYPVAGPPDHPVDGVDRRLGVALAQIPTRAFRDQEINQRRHDEEGEPAGQCHQPEGVRVVGQQKADQGQQCERAGNRHLIDGAEGAPMPRRHQLGGDRERRKDRKAAREACQQTHDDQLLARLHQGEQQGGKGQPGHADQHDGFAAVMVGDRRGDEAADDDHHRRRDGEKADLVGWQMPTCRK